MEATKEKLLADLYALRGGLSIISQNTDLIREGEQKIQGCQNRNALTSKELQKDNETIKRLTATKEEILLRIKEEETKIETAEREYNDNEKLNSLKAELKDKKSLKKQGVNEVATWVFWMGWISFAIGCIFCPVAITNPTYIFPAALAIVIYIISRIIFLVSANKEIKKEKAGIRNADF